MDICASSCCAVSSATPTKMSSEEPPKVANLSNEGTVAPIIIGTPATRIRKNAPSVVMRFKIFLI